MIIWAVDNPVDTLVDKLVDTTETANGGGRLPAASSGEGGFGRLGRLGASASTTRKASPEIPRSIDDRIDTLSVLIDTLAREVMHQHHELASLREVIQNTPPTPSENRGASDG